MYAIKQFQDPGCWVIVAITASPDMAVRIKRDREADKRRDFPLIAPKVVPVGNDMVQAYLTLGNRLW